MLERLQRSVGSLLRRETSVRVVAVNDGTDSFIHSQTAIVSFNCGLALEYTSCVPPNTFINSPDSYYQICFQCFRSETCALVSTFQNVGLKNIVHIQAQSMDSRVKFTGIVLPILFEVIRENKCLNRTGTILKGWSTIHDSICLIHKKLRPFQQTAQFLEVNVDIFTFCCHNLYFLTKWGGAGARAPSSRLSRFANIQKRNGNGQERVGQAAAASETDVAVGDPSVAGAAP